MSGICSSCDQPLTSWDYRYRGKHYCRNCCDRLFKLQSCSVCGRQKKIFIELKIPICKICQVKDKPCIRCGKPEYSHGMITSSGPVCNSCSVYFREPKTCSSCHCISNIVSNRTLTDGNVQLICQLCYNKTLPICYSCHKQRKVYLFDQNNHPICEICATEKERICRQCGNTFPAGKGRICSECAYENTLRRKVAFGSEILSLYVSGLYIRFGEWLKCRRGVLFAATHISCYLSYFSKLDDFAEELGRMPVYVEVVSSLSIRANLLVMVFLDNEGIIRIDKKVQEKYSNIDMITRYLERFAEGTWAQKAIDGYFEYLTSKTKDKASARSIRLTVGTAANLLSYTKHLDGHIVGTISLNGYLWKYPGQRDSITGFINYVNRTYHLKIEMPLWKHPELSVPKQGQMHLKQGLIDLLRSPDANDDYKRRLIRTAISYFHGVDIPENVYLYSDDLKQTKIGDIFIRIAGKVFYLPREILRNVNR